MEALKPLWYEAADVKSSSSATTKALALENSLIKRAARFSILLRVTRLIPM
jgi:hypothetical protein